VRLWSMPDGALQKTLQGHASGVYSVAFSPDGKQIASGSADYTVKLWSLPSGLPDLCLFDPAATTQGTAVRSYSENDSVVTDAVCTCDTVCTCNTVMVPAGSSLPSGSVCTCDTVSVGSAPPPSSSCGGGYWYPD